MPGVKVEDKDHGYNALVKKIDGMDRLAILVGVFEREGAMPHGDDAFTVLDVAAVHEFGTATIPQRSFIRAWFDENLERAREALRRLMVQALQGKMTPEQCVEKFGLWVQGEIQKRIAQGIPPPLAESTVEKKGSSVPLVNTGQLRSSVTFRVEKT